MKTMLHTLAAAAAVAAAGAAWAEDGLRLPAEPLAGWQARLGLTTPTLPHAAEFPSQRALALPSAQLLGDYYFTGPGFGGGRVTGGLRATSGLLFGARAPGLGPAAGGLTLRRADLPTEASAGALPYLGVGYTGLSARGGWGFSADLGLIGAAPRTPGLQWQRSGPSLDEMLRDLRLTPTVQLGVSYSF
jgi:hypothetical protein